MPRQRRWLGRRRPMNLAALFASSTPVITAPQCRAARALLQWHRQDLVRESGVSERTIAEFENGERKRAAGRSRRKLTDAFQRHGIEFIWPDQGKGPGLRLAATTESLNR